MNFYTRLNTGFYRHVKTLRLRLRIGDAAFWVPPRIWAFAAEERPDGNIAGLTAEELAVVIGYNSDPDQMLQALIDTGFLDRDPLRIHDWEDYNACHMFFAERARKAAQARWSRWKEKKNQKEKVQEKRREEKSGALLKQGLSNASSIAKHQPVLVLGVTAPLSAAPTPPPPLSKPKLPLEAEYWNSHCGSLPKVISVTDGRLKHLKARRQEEFFMVSFERAVVRAAQTPFLCGDNDRKWRASFDWLIENPDNIVKLMEGRYDNAQKPRNHRLL